MCQAKFYVGDVVRLRSGGPAMTVIQCVESDGLLVYSCIWLREGKPLGAGEFSEPTLIDA